MFKRFFYSSVLLSTALVDAPANMSAGQISVGGVLTILLVIGVVALLVRQLKESWHGFRRVWPLSALLLYSVLQCLWHRPSLQGYQNICLLGIFVGLIVLGLSSATGQPGDSNLARMLLWATAIASFCYGISILYDGLGTDSFIGSRSFAVYALLGLALLLGRWARGSRTSFWLAVGLTLLIAMSLSRTALVVGVLLFPLARLRPISLRSLARTAALSGIAACSLYFLVASTDALRARFLGENTIREYASGDASVETSGRLTLWAVTIDSFAESPWLGKGPGTANDLISSLFEGLGHPHNEYLRFLHDSGIFGLTLLLAGCVQVLAICHRQYRRSIEVSLPRASICLGTFLAMTAILLTMLTDNSASYTFVMGPLGILVGVTLRPLMQGAPWMSGASVG